ncbi:MAG TPA: 4-alpha-glucanotransferase [Xanthobacteraceae bacterium]|nr:4-alpha-glucanotransferase [Xanthobacteraceae bacterium]
MDRIEERAARWGIESQYHDAFGRLCSVAPEVLSRLLELLGQNREPAQRRVPQTVVIRNNREASVSLQAPPGTPVTWTIDAEGTLVQGVGEAPVVRLPADLPAGSFTLRIGFGDEREEATLLVAPERAFQGESAARFWGIAVQLYGVRSQRNWGHGDFTDLAALIDIAAERGADAIGLNPLHAIFDDHAEDASPYSPNSRLFLNTLYIDVEAVPGFPGLDAAGLRDEIENLRAGELVNYKGVARAKAKAMRLAYENFRGGAFPHDERAFEAFRAQRGSSLQRFAAFEWLRRRYGLPWQQWTPEWRNAGEAALARLRREQSEEIGFFEFVQWAAHEQLSACCDRIRRRGLELGLYLDIAVGVSNTGFDAWSESEAVLDAVSVGAPPDPLNLAGQNWGIAGTNPVALEQQRFEPFRRMLQASMHYAGAVRLDHVLGLKRLFLIPNGMPAGQGTYVRFPFEALLAVAAQESVANRCVVIGEDLGTVPEGFRDVMADWGLWSYVVMIFEREGDGRFRAPEAYPRNALATFNTHDLPTFAGWAADHDLAVKRQLGIDPGESDDDRARARAALRSALGLPDNAAPDFSAVAAYLARTPSRLLMVAMEDVLGILDQPNIPGTVQEHPNWRRRLPLALEDIAQHQGLAALADIMRTAGRG